MNTGDHAADVLVVGAGPAGLAAGLELRRLGIPRVLIVEREEHAGGVPCHAAHLGFGMLDMYRLLTGPRYADRYVHLARAAGVEIRVGFSVTDWSGPTALRTTSADGITELSARAVILATGCRERPRSPRLVPGARPLGVLTTGALQQFVYLRHERPGRCAVVVGAEHVSFSALLTLADAGMTTVAMVTEHLREQTYAPFKWASATRLGVPILTRTRVTEILGSRRVEAVDVEHLDTGARRRLACDTVIFTGDWIPDHELARQADLLIDPGTRGPRVDCGLRTSRRGVFAAGNLLHGAERADVAALSGRHAAHAVDEFLRADQWPTRSPISITCVPPLQWISPNAIAEPVAPPRGHFIARVSRFCQPGDLVVTQGARELWRRRHRRLIPNLPIHVPASWLRSVDPAGDELRFRFDEATAG